MNLPLFLPGMQNFIVTCLAFLAGAAIAVFLLKYKFKKSAVRKDLFIFILAIAGLVAAYLVFYTISNIIGRFQVETKLAKMRAQGIPLDKDAILPKMPDKASDNGASYYNAAFNLMDASSSCDTLNKMYREYTYSKYIDIAEWSEQDRKSIRQILNDEDIKLIINLFRRGSEKPYAVYERHYNGADTLLPELNNQRELLRLIRVKSFCEGLDGNPEAGYRLLRDGFKAIIQFKSEVFLISQLVNISCTSINIGGMNELVLRYGIPESSARQLLAELDKINFNQAMINGFYGDSLVWRDDIFEKIINGEKVRYIDKLVSRVPENIRDIILSEVEVCGVWPFFYQDYAHYLEQMDRVKNLFKKPYWAVEKEMDKLEKENKQPDHRIMTKLITNGLVSFRIRTARIESEIDAAKLTLALHIYKNQHGEFPNRLEELAPEILKEIPVDPISGKPFEYLKTGNTFALSSVWLKEKAEIYRKNSSKHNPGK